MPAARTARRDGCWHRHDEDDPRLGEPLCPACYDAQAQVLWNALAPELWRRTTIAVQRALARQVGLDEAELRQVVRVSYAKVAEFQRRGAIHFHAVIRLDAATDCRCPGCLAPPPEPFTAAPPRGRPPAGRPGRPGALPAPVDGGPDRYARWGEQLDVHNITKDSDQAGELSAEQVAGYIAKYATKATESFGSGLDRRLTADDLDCLDKLPAHVAELVRAAWELGGRPQLEGLRLRAWAHMLGFGGPLVDQEPPLLHHLGRPASGPGRLRQAPPGPRRRAPGCLGAARGRPGRDRRRLLGVRRLGLCDRGERWLALSAAARARNSGGWPGRNYAP